MTPHLFPDENKAPSVDAFGYLPRVWRTVQRGLLCISISLPLVCVIPILGLPIFFEHPDRARNILLVVLLMIGLLHLDGTIQCALVPDAHARGLMLGVMLVVATQLLLGFVQIIGFPLRLPGTQFNLLAEWAIVMHALLCSSALVLHLLFARRVAQIFHDRQLAKDAQGVMLFLLAWLAAVIGLIVANVLLEQIGVQNRMQVVLSGMNFLGAFCSFFAGVVFVPLFCAVLGLARDTIHKAMASK